MFKQRNYDKQELKAMAGACATAILSIDEVLRSNTHPHTGVELRTSEANCWKLWRDIQEDQLIKIQEFVNNG